ncbi:MAG: Oxo-4-hydroxy-4-carboxy-5-ureidoimidazoline decarboxylase [Piptocephalis tieghemiana]|nr:MAG: Oxo-4-hydroxy-4-carboxy-5-ureidoimidazoline decarboxylase [Piptocephalis tieghemiana]
MASSLPTIQEFNQLPPASFHHTLKLLFEDAPELFDRLYKQIPFSSYTQVLNAAQDILLSPDLPTQEKIRILNAHPRLGSSPASLSSHSSREQGDVDATVDAQLASLNAQYEALYGFRFVSFVNGRSRAEMAQVLSSFLDSHSSPTAQDKEAEATRALTDMVAIARSRLNGLSVPPSPSL